MVEDDSATTENYLIIVTGRQLPAKTAPSCPFQLLAMAPDGRPFDQLAVCLAHGGGGYPCLLMPTPSAHNSGLFAPGSFRHFSQTEARPMPTERKIQILVADDQEIVRSA